MAHPELQRLVRVGLRRDLKYPHDVLNDRRPEHETRTADEIENIRNFFS
jgi:hypothetical protein